MQADAPLYANTRRKEGPSWPARGPAAGQLAAAGVGAGAGPVWRLSAPPLGFGTYPSCSPWASPGGVSQPGPAGPGVRGLLLWVEANQGRCLDLPDLPGPQHSSQNPEGAGRRPRPPSAGPGQCKHGRLLNRKTQWGRSSGDPAGLGLLRGPAGSQPPPEPGPTFSSSSPPARLRGSEDTASVPLAPLLCLPDLECPSLYQLPSLFRAQ